MRAVAFSLKFCFVLLSVGGTVTSFAQDTLHLGATHSFTSQISPGDTSKIQLPHRFIIGGTESLWFDSLQLRAGTDYLLDSRSGRLTVFPIVSSVSHPLDSLRSTQLHIYYRALNFRFKDSYQRRIIVERKDTVGGQVVQRVKPGASFVLDDLFRSDLQKSGSIVRGFTVGSNRDLSLTSGFRMQMAGKLTDDINITAALTDENSPIQPEGTTQSLQEFDRVFIELQSKNATATLGDFTIDMEGNSFARFSRKLQGGQAAGNYRIGELGGSVLFAAASSRGKFASNQFLGLDGVQGPYRLTGRNGERTIIVIAGTERVYVNGLRMTRGETQDYTIDYSNGEVSFTSRRLVSRASRITVEFEYSDRSYNRNFIAARSGSSFWNDRWKLSATFVREGDDEDSPIDLELTDADRQTLQTAGGDRLKASRSGIELVGPGNGQYAVRDTTVLIVREGRAVDTTIFVYTPFDTLNAVYRISFSFVGFGQGDYDRVSVGHYRFVGFGSGSYLPLRLLPLPSSQSLFGLDLAGEVIDGLRLSGEYAASNFNRNQFSTVPGTRQSGKAVNLGLSFLSESLMVGDRNLGALDVRIHERYIDQQFIPFERINDVEFNRRWNVRDSFMMSDEELREARFSYQPNPSLRFAGEGGRIERGSVFFSNRYAAGGTFNDPEILNAEYRLETVRSREQNLDLEGSTFRNGATVKRRFGHFSPHISYEGEQLRDESLTTGILRPTSFRFHEIVPGLIVDSVGDRIALSASYGWRWDDSLSAPGFLDRASRTFTQRYGLELLEWKTLSSTLDIAKQNRAFTSAFRTRGNQDIESILLRWRSRYSPFRRGIETDWHYEAASERAAKLERLFQRVAKGSGNYIYIGDTNGNSIPDEPDFQLTRFDGDYIAFTVPTEEFVPVVNLRTSTRFRMNGDRFLQEPEDLAQRILSAISTETYFTVEEKSTERRTSDIYLLRFSKFLRDATTLQGSNIFTQDIFLLEYNPKFTARFRYQQRRSLTQFASQVERGYSREQSFQVRFQLIPEIGNQTDVIWKTDNLSALSGSNRARGVVSSEIATDWSYRPIMSVEFGFRLGVGRATNYDTTQSDLNSQSVRLIYAMATRGQLRTEFIREEAIVNRTFTTILPYELTAGRSVGQTWLWRLGFDYRLTQFLQAMLQYEGRAEGRRVPVHTARAEVSAFF